VPTRLDDIAKAHDLLAKGAITEAEFQQIKADLLAVSTEETPQPAQDVVVVESKSASKDARTRELDQALAPADPVTPRQSGGKAGAVAREVGGCAGNVVLFIVVSIVLVNLFMCLLLQAVGNH
jgi:hypothetical protein